MFPETAEKAFIREKQRREEDDEDEGGDAEGDIGMQTESEEESGKDKVGEFPRAESAEEKVERKRENECGHDGAEADAGKVDRPIRGGEHKCGEKTGDAPVEELSSQEIDAENGKGPEKNRPELESGDRVAENGD